jgi:hypothetical protein
MVTLGQGTRKGQKYVWLFFLLSTIQEWSTSGNYIFPPSVGDNETEEVINTECQVCKMQIQLKLPICERRSVPKIQTKNLCWK